MEEEDFSKVILEKTLYGTKEVTITWEDEMQNFKRNYLRAMSAIRHREEPTELLIKLSRFLDVIIDDPEIIKGDEIFEEFFYGE